MKIPAICVCIIASTTYLPAQNQTPPPPLTEKVQVSVVNVDVTVTGADGKPVSGLTKDDFEILEDGKPQTVTGFYAIEDAVVRLRDDNAPISADEEHQLQRKIVLMIDNNTLQRPTRDAALEFVARFVENKHEQEEWSVIAIGHGVETLQPFTTDGEAIRSALLAARKKPVNVQERAIDRDLLSDPVRARMRETPTAESGYDFDSTARFQSREQTARNLQAMKNSASALIQTVRAYSASSGRKALILLTGGMELNTSFGTYDSGKDRQLDEMKKDMERIVDTMVQQANAANFKVYIVKGGGQTSRAPQHEVSNRSAGLGGTAKNPFFGPGYTGGSDVSNVDSAPLALALRTGGQYFGSQVTEALEGIDDRLSNSYSLAYRPGAPEDGQYHRIEVKVKRPQSTVLHREGYLAISADQRIEQALRSSMIFAREKGTLPVNLQVGDAEKAEGDKRVVPLSATIPLQSIMLVPRGERRVGRVHVYLSIYDDKGTNVGYHHLVRDVAVPSSGDPLGAFHHDMKVGLKKGKFTIVVTMRDELSEEIGTGFKDVRL